MKPLSNKQKEVIDTPFNNTFVDKPVPENFDVPKEDNNALSKQIGGRHYVDFSIQPVEFVTRNHLSYLQGSIIFRICRYNLKGNALEDLQKAKHEIDLIIQLEGLND